MLGQTLDPSKTASSTSSAASASASATGLSGLLGDVKGDVKGELHNVSSSVEGDISNKIKQYAHDIARALNISDFYSLHLLDYCQGYYEPGPAVNATNRSPWQNVTACSNRTALFAWDPEQEIQADLPKGINVTDLAWSGFMQQSIEDARGALQATFVFYCMGAAAAGLALLCSVAGVLGGGPLVVLANCALDAFAFFALLIASAAVTWAINSTSNVINGLGNDIGIYAYRGTTFIGMTWAATVLMALAAAAWVVELSLGRKKGLYPATLSSKVEGGLA